MALHNDPTLPSPEPDPPRKSARPDPDDLTGQVLGNKYRVIRVLGRGGFGTVYEAKDEMLGASVAVKVLNRQAEEAEDSLKQFLREAQLLTSLDHANIVRWITFDRTPNGLHYFVMEFLRGDELSKLLNQKDRLPKEKAIAILLQILSALEAAHFLPDGRSLLHLDLKPNNVFVMRGDAMQIKVIDFGISQHVGAAARSAADIAAPARKKTDDEPGQTMSTIPSMDPPDLEASSHGVQRARGGTPLYASPEQCRHLNYEADIVELDGRSDIYSLGVMAFELLAGRLPWICRSKTEAFKAHLTLPAPSFASVGVRVPRRLERFVQRCLAKDREQRFADVKEARAELELIANPKQPWLAYSSAIAIVAAVVLWFVWPDPQPQIAKLEVPDNRVFLGSARRSPAFRVTNLLPALRGGSVRWVKEATDPQPILDTWRLRLDGQNVHIEAPADERIEGRSACLQFSDGSSTQFSQPVSITYLLPGRCKIAETKVRNANGRIIDPNGAVLEVVVETPDATWIESVTVECGTDKLNARPDPARIRQGSVAYVLPLQEFTVLAEQAQAATFKVLVTDKAGNEAPNALTAPIDPTLLSFRPELQGCPQGPDGAIVYPGSSPLLQLNATRPVETKIEGSSDVGPIVITYTKEGSDLRLNIPAGPNTYLGSLAITIDEQATVYHNDAARDRQAQRLPFRFEKEKPSLQVFCQDQSSQLLTDGSTYVTNKNELRLRLRRDNNVQTTVGIACRRGDALLAEQQVALHQTNETTVSIALPEDGVYSVTVSSFRHYGGARRVPSQEAEAQSNLTIVCDTKPLAVRLVEPPAKISGKVTADAVWFKAAIDEGRSTAMTLRWQLDVDGSPRRQNEIEIPPGPAAEEALTWSRLQLKPEELEDGSYKLSLTAVDTARNNFDLAPVTFVVARNGPQLSLKMQTPDWSDKEGDVFTLRIGASDPNGVAKVECLLELKSTGEKTDWFALTPADEKNRFVGDWVARCTLKSSWSDQEVSIRWQGADCEGNKAAEQSAAKRVASFEASMKPRIWHRAAANADAYHAMRFVRSSGRIPYVFGGRGEEQERAAFPEAFPGPKGPHCEPRSVDVADYYLDENEVTIAQYLAFVRSPGGYDAVKNWSEGSPDAERLKELQKVLGEAVDKQLPVTGLRWAECDAYARWAGKRLPSDVEWEYAARGGDSYRLFSCQGKDFKAAEFPTSCASPWPVDRGCDVVASGIAEGIRNLCSNVSEWTSTRKNELYYYAAGAYFRDRAYNFSIIRPYEPGIPRDDIGFRCAIDAPKVRTALEAGAGFDIMTDPPPNLPGK